MLKTFNSLNKLRPNGQGNVYNDTIKTHSHIKQNYISLKVTSHLLTGQGPT